MADDDLNYRDPLNGDLKIAVDEVSSKHFQKMKIHDATPGGTAPLKVDGTYGAQVDVARLAPELLTPLGYKQLTGLTAAKALSAVAGGIPAGAKYCRIQAEGASVRYRDDSTAPTAGVGMLIAAGDSEFLALATYAATQVQFIEVTATAKVNCSFYA